ncbi:MAG: hypothetical protein V7L20_31260 [Nostoc sp.]|uniref:hypothetical protein n=1 Tax=Nostoc sp. TaxID=1180 RepID=UPI002FF796CD
MRLSLQGTRHHLNNFIPELLAAASTKRQQIYRTLLKVIAHKPVSARPTRSEPRVRKRRSKAFSYIPIICLGFKIANTENSRVLQIFIELKKAEFSKVEPIPITESQ